MTASDRIRKRYATEMDKTRPLLALVPDDRMDWKPDPKSMALGRLAGHIAELSHWLREVCQSDCFEFLHDGKPVFLPFAATSNEELLARFDTEVTAATAALEHLQDDQLDHNWKATRGGVVMISGPRWDMIERFNIGHIIHHRAQLGVYLRLLQIPVPGVFGPSYDDKQASEKAAS